MKQKVQAVHEKGKAVWKPELVIDHKTGTSIKGNCNQAGKKHEDVKSILKA